MMARRVRVPDAGATTPTQHQSGNQADDSASTHQGLPSGRGISPGDTEPMHPVPCEGHRCGPAQVSSYSLLISMTPTSK